MATMYRYNPAGEGTFLGGSDSVDKLKTEAMRRANEDRARLERTGFTKTDMVCGPVIRNRQQTYEIVVIGQTEEEYPTTLDIVYRIVL